MVFTMTKTGISLQKSTTTREVSRKGKSPETAALSKKRRTLNLKIRGTNLSNSSMASSKMISTKEKRGFEP